MFWRLDGLEISYNAIFGATVSIPAAISNLPNPTPNHRTNYSTQWGLLAAALIFAAPVIWLNIKDTVTLEEDLKFSDETIEDVITTGAMTKVHDKEDV